MPEITSKQFSPEGQEYSLEKFHEEVDQRKKDQLEHQGTIVAEHEAELSNLVTEKRARLEEIYQGNPEKVEKWLDQDFEIKLKRDSLTFHKDLLEKMRGWDENLWVHSFLNNFHCHLPGGFNRLRGDESGMTPHNQLQRDLDLLIQKLSLDPKQIAGRETLTQNAETIQRVLDDKDYLPMLISLFVEMRKMGHQKEDLV